MPRTHELNETLRPGPSRACADGRFWQRELRMFCGDSDVTGDRQFESAPEGMTVDRRDNWLAQPGPLVEYLVSALDPPAPHVERLKRCPLVDIRTNTEGLLACAGQKHHAHVGFGFDTARDGFQLIEHGGRQRIKLRCTDERDDADVAVALVRDEWFSHGAPPRPSTAARRVVGGTAPGPSRAGRARRAAGFQPDRAHRAAGQYPERSA